MFLFCYFVNFYGNFYAGTTYVLLKGYLSQKLHFILQDLYHYWLVFKFQINSLEFIYKRLVFDSSFHFQFIPFKKVLIFSNLLRADFCSDS